MAITNRCTANGSEVERHPLRVEWSQGGGFGSDSGVVAVFSRWSEWCATLPFRERLGPRSKGWAVIVRHLLRLEIDAQRGAFDLAGEFDTLFVPANCGIARRSFLGEEEDGGRD
jgi:hypothetical protein